jgi:radical SAM protein with 4Fe4S-binding SPASM domain
LRLDYFIYYRLARHWRLRVAAVKALEAVGKRFLALRLDLTNTCNLRCRMCYLSTRREKPVHISRDQIDRLAAELFPATRNIYLSCGYEPLMAKNLFHCLQRVKESPIPFSTMISNGQLLDREKIFRLMELGLRELIVSMDSPDPATYNSIRGGGFSKLLANLELLEKMKRDRGTGLPELRLNVTLMRDNINQLPGLVELAARLGARYIHLRHMDYFPEAVHDFLEQTLYRMPDEANAVIARSRDLASSKGIFLDTPPPLPPLEPRTEEGFSGEGVLGHCPYPWFQVLVRLDGDLAPCSYWQGAGLGNIYRQHFREIWTEGFGPLRKTMWQGGVPEGCRQCSINGGAKDFSRLWARLDRERIAAGSASS